jgi:ADP-ribose pyrophosphatase
MSVGEWRLLRSEEALVTPWLRVDRNAYDVPGHGIIEDYFVVTRDNFVLIVAFAGAELLLVRQYRPATGQHYLGLPAGYLAAGEAPEEAAARELVEETGFRAEGCKVIGELHPLPGYLRSRAFVVSCRAIPTGQPALDDAEIESTVPVSMSVAVNMIKRGEINEMQAVSAILLTCALDEPDMRHHGQ